MQLNSLKREHPNKKARQVGRGGTRGKTAGRGGKGQTARAGNKRRPQIRDIIKKIPKYQHRQSNFTNNCDLQSFEILKLNNVNILKTNT